MIWFWMKEKAEKEKMEAEKAVMEKKQRLKLEAEKAGDKLLHALYDAEAKIKGSDVVGSFDKWNLDVSYI